MYLLENHKLTDLNPIILGEEACAPGHRFGPAVRRYVLIHYILKGKGIFYARGNAYPVEAGQAFLILPEETTTYQADADDPWHYLWIGFDGVLSADFATLPPVFPLPAELLSELPLPPMNFPGLEYHLAGILFRLYAHFFCKNQGSNSHVQKVKSYIKAAYMQPIRVEEIARHLNLDRRYLSRLFRKHTGQSIQNYLISVRMKEATNCLRKGCSVHEAAGLCGYEDVSCFSRMFKQHYGISPAHWKKNT